MVVFYLWSDRHLEMRYYVVDMIWDTVDTSSKEHYTTGDLRPLHPNENIWIVPGTFEGMYNR